MKRKNQTLLKLGKYAVAVLFVGATLASCSKDKSNDNNDGISRQDFSRNYFDVNGGDFSGKALPGSNSSTLEITNVSGNSTVLAGGTNTIKVTGNEGAREVIVGVKNQDGYFTIPMTSQGSPRGGNAMMEADVRMIVSQQLQESFTLAIGVGDGQGNFGPFQFMEVNLLQAGTGKLQVSVQWDQENDVDLHLTEPNGTRIYYGSSRSSNGGELDVDSNAACYLDHINNENITYAYPDDNPNVIVENGEYLVEVDLWSNCDVSSNTSYTVIAHYNGVLINPTEGVNPHYGTLTPEDESHNSNRKTVMKFAIDGTSPKGLPANEYQLDTPKAVKFSFDKNNKVFENFSRKK